MMLVRLDSLRCKPLKHADEGWPKSLSFSCMLKVRKRASGSIYYC